MNTRDRTFTKNRIASRLAHLEADVARHVDDTARIDRQEEGETRADKAAHLGRRYGRIRQEIARLKAMEQALKEAPDGQISLTDPDARAMATNARHSGMVGYTVQTAVDTERHLIVAHDVTNQGFDRDQLRPMAAAAKTALERDDLHAIADKGYFSGSQILACHQAGITTTVPRPETSGNRARGMYVKADFADDPARDAYLCPAGEESGRRRADLPLHARGGRAAGRPLLDQRMPELSGPSPLLPAARNAGSPPSHRCKQRLPGTGWEHEQLVEAMRKRLGGEADPMTLRRCTVEHPFGTLKAWMGHTHFLTRKLKNVRTEMALNVLAYNLKRVVALIGIQGLMRAMAD